ncbi:MULTISPECIES: hypothetical protein [unclassified Acinetobacter]|uniref:hypothetical protein n=1 Tax=unclassified Acinetobacter TaxID=196816 RepID=UPI0015D1D4F1|nr:MULTISPECIES: hypothetical protein [unclassified Acinetobacter]
MNNFKRLDFESFKRYNYILYEQTHFRNLLSVYQENKVNYKIIAINLFKKREKAPILVDLKSMNADALEDFYNNIFLKEFSTGLSLFQNMGLVSNLVKSKLEFDDFSKIITSLLMYNSENIIRFYDPRVNIHLLNINQYSNLNLEMRIWLRKFNSIFDEWCICTFGCYFGFISQESKNDEKINFSIHQIDKINQKFKKHDFESTQEIEIFLKENYKRLVVKD